MHFKQMANEPGRIKAIQDDGQLMVELSNCEKMKTLETTKQGIPPLRPEWIEALPNSDAHYDKLSKIQLKLIALLVEASAEGDLFFKDIIHNYKLDVNAGHNSKDGVTALQAACYHGHPEIAEWLLKNGADVEKQDSKGRRAIYYAVKGYVKNL